MTARATDNAWRRARNAMNVSRRNITPHSNAHGK
jgi:hypothetical protein